MFMSATAELSHLARLLMSVQYEGPHTTDVVSVHVVESTELHWCAESEGKRERACVSIRAFRVGRNEGDPTATREGRVERRVERDFERRDGLCAVRTTSSRDASPCAAVATNDDVGRFPRTEKRAR
jgi:hypothetical protein